MSKILQFRRGLKANIPQLAEGEIGFATDVRELYVGGIEDGNPVNILLAKLSDIGEGNGNGGGSSTTKEDLLGEVINKNAVLVDLDKTEFDIANWSGEYYTDSEITDDDIIDFINKIEKGKTYEINNNRLTASFDGAYANFYDGFKTLIYSFNYDSLLDNYEIVSRDNLSETGLVIKEAEKNVLGKGLIDKIDIIGEHRIVREALRIEPEDIEAYNEESPGWYSLIVKEEKADIDLSNFIKQGKLYSINNKLYKAFNIIGNNISQIMFIENNVDDSKMDENIIITIYQDLLAGNPELGIGMADVFIDITKPFIIYEAVLVDAFITKKELVGEVDYELDYQLFEIDEETFENSIAVNNYEEFDEYYSVNDGQILEGLNKEDFVEGRYYLVNGKPLKLTKHNVDNMVFYIFGEYALDFYEPNIVIPFRDCVILVEELEH